MTLTEFYRHVRECGPWEVTPDGIRQCDTGRCPVNGVGHKLTNLPMLDNQDWDVTAQAIELDSREAHEIVCAADAAYIDRDGFVFCCPDPALAAACGFTEEGASDELG